MFRVVASSFIGPFFIQLSNMASGKTNKQVANFMEVLKDPEAALRLLKQNPEIALSLTVAKVKLDHENNLTLRKDLKATMEHSVGNATAIGMLHAKVVENQDKTDAAFGVVVDSLADLDTKQEVTMTALKHVLLENAGKHGSEASSIKKKMDDLEQVQKNLETRYNSAAFQEQKNYEFAEAFMSDKEEFPSTNGEPPKKRRRKHRGNNLKRAEKAKEQMKLIKEVKSKIASTEAFNAPPTRIAGASEEKP